MRVPRTLALLLLAGCGVDAAPEEPSWQVDVLPILAANCVRCHGYPSRGIAPVALRLDAFGTTPIAGPDGTIEGAVDVAPEIAIRVRLEADQTFRKKMPPDRRLDDHEIDVLRNWASAIDDNPVGRGLTRPDNTSPVLTVTEVSRAGGVITFAYELRDADRDLAIGWIGPRIDDQGQPGVAVIGDLVAGRGTFAWDTTGVPAGMHELFARLDDGADIDGPEGGADYVEVSAVTVQLP